MRYVFSPTRRWRRPRQNLQAALQDASCSILVTVGNVATERTDMRTDTEGLLHILTTVRTLLRSVVRCDGNKLAASMFGFALKIVSQYSPGCIGYGKGQTMVTYHVGRFQIFNNESLIVFDIVMRSFMQRVLALMSHTLMMARYSVFGFLMSVTSLLALRKLALGVGQFLSTLFRVFGVIDTLPIAVSDEVPNTHIQPYSIIFLREWFRFCLTDTLEVPARRAQHDTSKLKLANHRTVNNDANTPTHLLRSLEPSIIQAVRCIPELDSIPSIRILEAGEANFTAFLVSTKEIRKRAVKAFKRSIYNHSRQVGVLGFSMSLILFIDVQIFARLFVVSYQLLKTGIVHLAGGYQHLHQGLLLLFIGSHSVLVCSHMRIIANYDL